MEKVLHRLTPALLVSLPLAALSLGRTLLGPWERVGWVDFVLRHPFFGFLLLLATYAVLNSRLFADQWAGRFRWLGVFVLSAGGGVLLAFIQIPVLANPNPISKTTMSVYLSLPVIVPIAAHMLLRPPAGTNVWWAGAAYVCTIGAYARLAVEFSSFHSGIATSESIIHALTPSIAGFPLAVTFLLGRTPGRGLSISAIIAVLIITYAPFAVRDYVAGRQLRQALAWPARAVEEFVPYSAFRARLDALWHVRPGEPVQIGRNTYRFSHGRIRTVLIDKTQRPPARLAGAQLAFAAGRLVPNAAGDALQLVDVDVGISPNAYARFAKEEGCRVLCTFRFSFEDLNGVVHFPRETMVSIDDMRDAITRLFLESKQAGSLEQK